MRLRRIRAQAGASPACARITDKGLRGDDEIVTVTDEEALAFCHGEGKGGLCTAKFTADLILDELPVMVPGETLCLGDARLVLTKRRKSCHPGCRLDPAACRLNGRLYFFYVTAPGEICVGDCARIDKN